MPAPTHAPPLNPAQQLEKDTQEFFANMKVGAAGRGDPAKPPTAEKVNFVRRMVHSLRDYANTIGPARKDAEGKIVSGNVSGGKSHLTRTGQVVDGALTATSAAATVASGLAIKGAIVTTGVVLGTVTFLSGGIAGVVFGALGLGVLFVKSAYSNRDAAHQTLQDYAWSLVDSKSPPKAMTADGVFVASAAAASLLDSGKNQIQELGTKMQLAADRLRSLNKALVDNERLVNDAGSVAEVTRLQKKNKDLILAAMRPSGEIYEFTRRIVHTGNYIQAPAIVALAMKAKFDPGNARAYTDYFEGWDFALKSRALFREMAAFYAGILDFPDIRDNDTMDRRKDMAGNAAANTVTGRAIGDKANAADPGFYRKV